MDIYSLVQKLPEELVRVIASYDPTKELKRKQLKESFEGIHHTAKWQLNIRNHFVNHFRIQKVGATIWDVIQFLVVCCCFGCYDERYDLRITSKYREGRDFRITLGIDNLMTYVDLLIGSIGGIRNLDLEEGRKIASSHPGNVDDEWDKWFENNLCEYDKVCRDKVERMKQCGIDTGCQCYNKKLDDWRGHRTESIPEYGQ